MALVEGRIVSETTDGVHKEEVADCGGDIKFTFGTTRTCLD